MEDATIQAIFDKAATADTDGEKEISAPGAAGILVLLESSSLWTSLNKIEGVYDRRGWPANHSLSLEDFQDCFKDLALRAINSVDEDDNAEEAKQLVAIIDAIGDRMEQKTFPPVKPEEMHGADACSAAQETLQLISKTEAIELQILPRYQVYRVPKDCSSGSQHFGKGEAFSIRLRAFLSIDD